MPDTVTALCGACGATLRAAGDTPDDEVIICPECGAEIGSYREVREALISKARGEVERMFSDTIKRINKRR